LQDSLKFTQIEIFGLKISHLATLGQLQRGYYVTGKRKSFFGREKNLPRPPPEPCDPPTRKNGFTFSLSE
jgi:hypothetical protein